MDTGDTLNVVVIEKNEDCFIRIKELLAGCDERFQLDWVKSYEEGLDAVCRPGHDAFLIGDRLGERTGLELLAEAGRKGCDPPMVLLAGSCNRHGDEIEVSGPVCCECLAQDKISPEVLLGSIKRAIEGKRASQGIGTVGLTPKEPATSGKGNRIESSLLVREWAELALKQSEEKFRTLVESALDVIFTVSLEGKILTVNPAFEEVTGWRPAEWIGKDYAPLIHPDDLPLLQRRREQVILGRELSPAEMRIRTKSGGFKFMEFNSAPYREGDKIVGIIGTARDVTSKKTTEGLLVRQNLFLNTVLDSLSHPFYVLDAKDYRILMANSAASPRGIPSGLKCFELFHRNHVPCTGDEHFCPLNEIKKSKKPLITEHTHYDQDGNACFVEIHAYPIFDQEGEVVQVIEYILDITDRKKMEEDLRKAHDELEIRVQQRTAELASMNSALISEILERKRVEKALRMDEIRLEALQELSQMTWASEEEVANYVLEQQVKLTGSKIGLIGFVEGERVLKLHTWTTGEIPECGLPETPLSYEIAGSGVWADAVRLRKPVILNDPLPLESRAQNLPCGSVPIHRLMSIPVFDGEKIIAVAVVANKDSDYEQADVRQLTLLMDGMWKLMLRERTMSALRDAESLAGIGRALSSVAHDIKTPLVAIGGFARLVQGHLEQGSGDWAKMDIVLRETSRLEQMVVDMLDFSKPLELERSPEDIHRLVGESVEIAEQAAREKGIRLQFESSRIPVPALVDGARLKQAVINLMMNAIEASPAGRTVKLDCRSGGSELFIEVTDCGCGVPPLQRKEIFLPFFTTKRHGTGLGLPIVKKIAEAHKGRVEIIDNPEGGATFRIVLPIHHGRPENGIAAHAEQ